jgi:PKD repeat protein
MRHTLLLRRSAARSVQAAFVEARPRSRTRSLGQAVVEFAIILPIFMLLMLMAIDFGRLFFSYVQVSNAAREAAAWASNNPSTATSATLALYGTQEKNAQGQGGEGTINFAAACVDTTGATILCANAGGGAGPGNTITVTATEPFSFLTPLINNFFGGSFSIGTSASSVAQVYPPSTSATNPPGCVAPTAAIITVSGDDKLVNVDGSGSQPNTGLCHISGYNWTFGDGATDASYATGTTHTYSAPGTYTITLVVTNQGGSATATTSVTVPLSKTCLVPNAAFSIAPATGTAGGTTPTTFGYDASASTNMGVPACNPHYAWSFGDGATGPDAVSTTHRYGATWAGKTVTVGLTVSNDAGSDQAVQTITFLP